MGLRGIAVNVVYYPTNFGNIKLLLLRSLGCVSAI